MKKTIKFLAFLAAPLAIAACTDNLGKDELSEYSDIRMTLDASVSQEPETKAAFDDVTASTWNFSFTENDKVSVTNSRNIKTYYTFTKPAEGNFSSSDAVPTTQLAAWYAYYPQVNASGIVNYYNQAGSAESVASLYALSGMQSSVNPGTTSLSVSMSPKMAVLKVVSNTKNINLRITNESGEYFYAMKASLSNFVPQFSAQTYAVLNASQKGTYYVCVPAGQKINIYNGTTLLKSTKTAGLSAGKYYTITIEDPADAILLKGEFSVSGGKKVRFTKGNLYRDVNNEAWHIEPTQTSYPTEWNTSHVGHFFFCSSGDLSKSYSASAPTAMSFGDIFWNPNDLSPRTIEGIYNRFFNLSVADWTYLFNTRPNAANLFKIHVRVADNYDCTVVAPDGFTGTIELSYETEEEVTAAGLLCLPCAGYRNGTTIHSYSADDVDSRNNRYWTQSPDPSNSQRAQYFMWSATYTSLSRSTGLPLRLAIYTTEL